MSSENKLHAVPQATFQRDPTSSSAPRSVRQARITDMIETVVTHSHMDRAKWAKSLDETIWGGSLSCHLAGQHLGDRRLTSGRKTNARSGNSKVSRPNIVVIAWNDMGFSGINCGGSEIETRNRDRLAEGEIHFVNFHSNTQRRRNPSFTDDRNLASTTAELSQRG